MRTCLNMRTSSYRYNATTAASSLKTKQKKRGLGVGATEANNFTTQIFIRYDFRSLANVIPGQKNTDHQITSQCLIRHSRHASRYIPESTGLVS